MRFRRRAPEMVWVPAEPGMYSVVSGGSDVPLSMLSLASAHDPIPDILDMYRMPPNMPARLERYVGWLGHPPLRTIDQTGFDWAAHADIAFGWDLDRHINVVGVVILDDKGFCYGGIRNIVGQPDRFMHPALLLSGQRHWTQPAVPRRELLTASTYVVELAGFDTSELTGPDQ